MPWSQGDVPLDVPADTLAAAEAVRLSFDYADGRNLATYRLRLRPEHVVPPPSRPVATDVTFPHLNLTTVTYANNRVGWHWAIRHPGQLMNATLQRTGIASAEPIAEAALYAIPLATVHAVDADVRQPDGPTEPVAHLHADIENGRVSYELTWQAATAGDIQELGWASPVDGKTDHFSWHRPGYWSWYPADHIGRPAGTATPDSADADITRVTRPDAFDFNSTKYDCDWADLRCPDGSGLAVTFDSTDREHCRARRVDGGGYEVVVNRQCSPPRDLSSAEVPDLYVKLAKGQQVTGSFHVGTAATVRK